MVRFACAGCSSLRATVVRRNLWSSSREKEGEREEGRRSWRDAVVGRHLSPERSGKRKRPSDTSPPSAARKWERSRGTSGRGHFTRISQKTIITCHRHRTLLIIQQVSRLLIYGYSFIQATGSVVTKALSLAEARPLPESLAGARKGEVSVPKLKLKLKLKLQP